MSTKHAKGLFARLGGVFELVGSAAAAANAVENGRAPQARDLHRLGIDARQFRSIGHV